MYHLLFRTFLNASLAEWLLLLYDLTPFNQPLCHCISLLLSFCSIEVNDSGGLDRESDNLPPPDQASEPNLWERLGNAAMLDIESGDFSWDGLSSLHHTEHTSSAEYSEDEMNKPIEVCYPWTCVYTSSKLILTFSC